MKTLEAISNFISKYMAAFVIIVAAIALFMPWTFTWSAKYVTYLLGIVMFGMGMTLRFEDFKLVFKRPKDVFIGALAQFTIMPALAWVLATLFQLPPELAVGVILVGTCPGGTSSNVMTYLARGDVALSVSMTMTTTILAPIVTPILSWWLAGAWIDISLQAMMISIIQVVVVPIALGIIINKFFGDFVRKAIKLLPLISVIAIVLIVGGVVSVSAQKIMETGLLIMAVVILHNMLGYALGFAIAKALKMDMAKSKAISIEVGMQNSGLATSLAMMHFGAVAAIPGAIFSVWHNISGSLAANYLAGKMDKEEKAMFMQDLGIEESGLDKLIKEAYSLLGLRTYFTAGVQEVRAWTFKEGMTAPEMAGIIHSDFQRGFIKAETYSFDDLVKYGSEHALKEAGKIRQEGKQYVGQDGDIMLFKFNV